MTVILPTNPRFQIIDSKTVAYAKFKDYFLCLEDLFWLSDSFLTESRKKLTQNQPTSLQLIALTHLVWLSGQIRGILLLLNEALVSQAQQLIRTLWESKINLIYIAKEPNSRTTQFSKKALKEFQDLIREIKKDNPNLPSLYGQIEHLLEEEQTKETTWSDKIFKRAKDIGLEDEYNKFYKVYSWPSHASPPSLVGFIKIGEETIDYDPNESVELIPMNAMMAIGLVYQILKEADNAWQMLNQQQMEMLEKKISNIALQFEADNSKFIVENLPSLMRTFAQEDILKNLLIQQSNQ